MLPQNIQNLIDQFNKLPGIGLKTAERFVFHLLKQHREEISLFIQNLESLKKIILCSSCFNITENNPCSLCRDLKRDKKSLCVVAEWQDLAAIEKTKEYHGFYFVLGGTLNPLEGITPKELRIKQLLERIKKDKPQEIIFAFNFNLEGESTILYLTKLLKPFNLKTTRLARGLPMGSDLEYADSVTLSDALKERKEI